MLIAGFLAAAMSAGGDPSALLVSRSKLIVDDGSRPRDIRWCSASEVCVALGRNGVIRTTASDARSASVVMPAGARGGFPVSSRLAIGRDFLLVGSSMGPYGWMRLPPAAASIEQRSLLTLVDLDARGDAVAILGAESGDVQGLARDGVIAWTGSLTSGPGGLRALMTGRAKPGGKDMARCGILETGAIRFMLDGSIVVVPGTEPGVYRYDAAGRLTQTWDTESFGIVDDCNLDEILIRELAADFARRSEWLAARIVLEDVVPLRNAAGLIVRRVHDGLTRWDLLVLPFDEGTSKRLVLPLTHESPQAHVRGDVRGNRLALLLYDAPLPGQPGTPGEIFVMGLP